MESSSRKKVSRKGTVPFVFGSDLFQDAGDSRFAIGVFSAEDVLNYEKSQNELIKGYLQLRANTYIDYANILGDEARRPDGTELDEYDKYSIHFVAYEKLAGGVVAVVGTTRLIVKTSEDDLLPIESTFKDQISTPIDVDGIEVSRFIINHCHPIHQRKLKAKMIMTTLAYVFANKLGPIVGIIENRFKRHLTAFGVSTKLLAEPIFVNEGSHSDGDMHTTELLAVEILPVSIEKSFGKTAIDKMSMAIGDFTYWGKSQGVEITELNEQL